MESPLASPTVTKYCWEESSSCMPAFFPQNNRLLFGVPKKGRIHQEVMNMLKGAGIDAKKPDRLDVAECKDLPITLVFLPAADIPSYVMEGNVDIGISGSDMIEEVLLEAGHPTGHFEKDGSPVKVLMKLGIGKCKLCLQAPVAQCSQRAVKFAGRRIVTSFPHVTRKFIDALHPELGPKTIIRTVSGSVEAACSLGLADAVVDLVETGTTMKAAGLDVVTDVFETEAVLFTGKKVLNVDSLFGNKADLIQLVKQRIEGYLTATHFVMVSCNCHTDNLTQICGVLPGQKSTTVTALREENWHAASGLVPIKDVHTIMDKLTEAGAKDILCLNLSNTRVG